MEDWIRLAAAEILAETDDFSSSQEVAEIIERHWLATVIDDFDPKPEENET